MPHEPTETTIGCDFGASARAGEQAKKIILIEAIRHVDGTYSVTPTGRNTRIVRKLGNTTWRSRRRGWTAVELAASLCDDKTVSVAAFDFPFSIPTELLKDESFAARVGQQVFRSRRSWTKFIARELTLQFDSPNANGRLIGLEKFDPWRSQEFWIKRATDVAARSQPSLKHLYQSTFAMTLVGSAVLSQLAKSGLKPMFEPNSPSKKDRRAIEAYPGAAARSVGFAGAYKQEPRAVIVAALAWLADHDIRVEIDRRVLKFCETYCSSPNDHDGADAFLCLTTAIAYREGLVTFLAGDASQATLRQEGCIVVPQNSIC